MTRNPTSWPGNHNQHNGPLLAVTHAPHSSRVTLSSVPAPSCSRPDSLMSSRRSLAESAWARGLTNYNLAGAEQGEQRLIEGLHAELAGFGHHLLESVHLSLADDVGDERGVEQDLEGGDPALPMSGGAAAGRRWRAG